MKVAEGFEFPPDKQDEWRRARRIEWWTLAYLISAIAILALVLGSSQAMRTAWFDDVLSLIPPIVFLIASRISLRRPNGQFPYGYHRATAAAHLGAALALVAMGAFLLVEAIVQLVEARHPTIGTVEIFGHVVWLGWLMLAALLWSGIPAIFLGRRKLPLAEGLHDRVLYADAKMNEADWHVTAAAGLGVLGIGFGIWWADAAAAAVISLDILHDGWSNLRVSVLTLMDERPQKVTRSGNDPLPERVTDLLKRLDWVEDAQVRLRDEGHILMGDAFVVPRTGQQLVAKIEEAVEQAKALDWRLHDLAITPVSSIPSPGRSSRRATVRRTSKSRKPVSPPKAAPAASGSAQARAKRSRRGTR